jgi:hypothetical protein
MFTNETFKKPNSKEQDMKVKKLTKKAAQLEKEAKNRMFTAIAAAFALVIALSWNEAIKGVVQIIIDKIGLVGEGPAIKIAAAIITTIICAIGIVYASRINGTKK